jgi:hypothetical protein
MMPGNVINSFCLAITGASVEEQIAADNEVSADDDEFNAVLEAFDEMMH